MSKIENAFRCDKNLTSVFVKESEISRIAAKKPIKILETVLNEIYPQPIF